jgi:predicted Holliday junction resolvase-like endonuclease
MDPLLAFWIFLVGIIAGLLIGLTLIYRTAVAPLHKKIDRLTNEKQSFSTTHGKLSEQFSQLMREYPYPPQRFRFIGNPIDGVQFEDDRIIFVKIKTDQAQLSQIQKHIKQLVEEGKVEWFEFTVR